MGSRAFARRYSRDHFCFLFLRVLRCFSSPGSPPPSGGCRDRSRRVAPFGNPRIKGYLPLRADYRGLSRPSSPPRAKASFTRPSLLSFYLLSRAGLGRRSRSLLVSRFEIVCLPPRQRFPASRSFPLFRSSMSMCSLFRVENNGFEPLTPCLQNRCSSQLS